jgi:cell filamentation protein, protein adenylyltransferase
VAHDPYVDPATGVLRNRLGITDARTLALAEARFAYHAEIRLYAHRPHFESFDLAALQAVHRHLFGDIYPWAGELRTVDIIKGTTYFARAQHLHTSAASVLNTTRLTEYRPGHDRNAQVEHFALDAARLLADLNALHPFREGNGRTQRAFLQLAASDVGYELHWGHISRAENDEASRLAMSDDQAFLPLLQRITRPGHGHLDLDDLTLEPEHRLPDLDI